MKTIRKAFMALELLDQTNPSISVGEASRRLRLPKSTTSRLLSALGAVGLLELDPVTRRYGAGPAAGRLGALYRASIDRHQLIRQKLADLAKLTGHSCWMGVLAGREIVVLYNAHGNHPVRYVVEPGTHLPAFSTAMGRALLCALSDREIRRLFSDRRARSASNRARSSLADVLRVVHATRARGWSAIAGDNFAGVGAIGCALNCGTDQPTVGMSISYPLSSVDRREVVALRKRLLETLSWLEAHIGGVSPGNEPRGDLTTDNASGVRSA